MESLTKWPQSLPAKREENASFQMQNGMTLQNLLRRESLSSSLPISLLPPTRKSTRGCKQLADGLMVSGNDGDGEYYFRLGAWALHWLPAFIYQRKK